MYVVGFTALIARATTESELSTLAGEWSSDVLRPPPFSSSMACFLFDVSFGELAKRVNVKLIYEDVKNTIQKVSLFDSRIETIGQSEQRGTFEFHLKNVFQYQVCTEWAKKTGPFLTVDNF